MLDVIFIMQFGLVHISAGDLLREEIATGSENGKKAKEFMEKGMLVPDEIVVMVLFYFCYNYCFFNCSQQYSFFSNFLTPFFFRPKF